MAFYVIVELVRAVTCICSINYLLGCYWLSMELCRIVMFRKRKANNSFVGPLDRNVALVPHAALSKICIFHVIFPLVSNYIYNCIL